MKAKREIKFVLSGEEIKLLTRVDNHFLKQFSGKNLRGTKYEFTYSYEALQQLGFYTTGASYFTAAKKLKPRFKQLSKKINTLLKLSDSLSREASKRKKIRFCSLAFIFFLLVCPFTQSVAETLPAVESYAQLVKAIRQARGESRARIEQAVEQEKVREAWEIGKLIDEHILQHKERANYGEQVLKRLSSDLGTSDRELYYNWQFAKTYPTSPPTAKLSWAHYRELLSLNDSAEREEVTKQAVSQNWTRDRLREEVRRRQLSRRLAEQKESPEIILVAEPGEPETYRVVKATYGKQPNQLVLDLGFSNYYRPPGKFPFKAGDIIAVQKGRFKKFRLKKLKDAGERNLFTYSATVVRVIDGDTFTAAVELGFGFTTVQTLRLRALDAPEIESADGREAKEFLELSLRGVPQGNDGRILIRTHKSDKYDRYLADVFVNGEYVNQKLVEEGLAMVLSE